MNIVDLLRLDFLSLPQRVRLVTALSAGPWCWPCKPADEVAAVSHGGPRPPLPVGGCLLVTDGEDASSLWVENVPRGVRAVERPLGTVAQQAWREATTAAHRALPYLTGLPRGWDDMPRVLHRIAYHAKDHRRATLPPSLDGPSFGLAFLLGRASYLMEHPVPANVVACATVAEDGRLGLVDGLDGKLGVISNWARQVRTVLVAKRQVDLWRDRAQALGLAMDFRGFDKASQAVEWVFAAAIRRRFEDTPRDTREAHAEHLFRLALRRRDDVVDWLPVAAAASTMREVWKPESDGNQAWRLRFAHAIAARHEGRAVELTLPPSSFFDTLVLPRQLVVAAHLVMHVADVGSPPAAEVERFVGPLLERADTGEGQMLVGALARQLARRGAFDRALELQRKAARYFEALDDHRELSFPLSEWYRLCGCVEPSKGHAALAQADRFHSSMRCQPLTAHGQAYVDLHRAASLVRLHAVDDRSRAFLEASSEDLGIASHVRYSSMRLLVRHRRDRGDEFGAAKVLSKLEHATQHDSDPAQASIFLDLAMLDQAVTEASGARARAALVVFREHFPAIVDELLAVRDDPAFVARAFPYERVSTVPLVAAAFVSPGDRSPAASTSPPLPLAHATLAPARLSSQEAMCLPFGPELGLKTSSVTRPTTT